MNNMVWKPIETAPKEGGPILLFEPPGDEDQIGVGYYEPVTDHEGTEWLTFWETGVRCDATHWMPLPPPPEKGEWRMEMFMFGSMVGALVVVIAVTVLT